MFKTIKTVCPWLACFFLLVVAGCVETSMMYQGNSPSPAMHVVSLQQGENQAGTWETFDMTINFKYTLQSADVLEISGQAFLSEHYQMNYGNLSRLDVFMFFLDESSRVLKTAKVTRAMTGDIAEIMTFSGQYAVPAEAKSLSFGYDGSTDEVYEGGASFYELPLKKN